MALSINKVGDNPQQPGVRAETYIPDQLIAGNLKIVSQPIILNAGTLPRGAVLGMVNVNNVIITPGNNKGDGVINTVMADDTAKAGNYELTATSAKRFHVVDPEGRVLSDATVDTAYAEGGISFMVTAGSTAFVADDSFMINVADAMGQFVLSVKTASDGSQIPSAILADDADASEGPVTTGAYVMAEVNAQALYYDKSWTIATLTPALRANSVFVKSAVSASDPTPPPPEIAIKKPL